MDQATNVLLFCMPRMVRDMVREIVSGRGGLTVVAELECGEPLLPAVTMTDADVVVLSTVRSELSEEVEEALRNRPALRILAIAADGAQGFVYEMRPHRVPLGAISPRVLIDALQARGGGEIHAGAS